MPPGKRVDNPLTLLPAGMLGVLYNIGLKACYVRTERLQSSMRETV